MMPVLSDNEKSSFVPPIRAVRTILKSTPPSPPVPRNVSVPSTSWPSFTTLTRTTASAVPVTRKLPVTSMSTSFVMLIVSITVMSTVLVITAVTVTSALAGATGLRVASSAAAATVE